MLSLLFLYYKFYADVLQFWLLHHLIFESATEFHCKIVAGSSTDLLKAYNDTFIEYVCAYQPPVILHIEPRFQQSPQAVFPSGRGTKRVDLFCDSISSITNTFLLFCSVVSFFSFILIDVRRCYTRSHTHILKGSTKEPATRAKHFDT